MNYVISTGATKNIQVGDALTLVDDGIEVSGGFDFFVVAQDVSQPDAPTVTAISRATRLPITSFKLSPSWVLNVWRPQ